MRRKINFDEQQGLTGTLFPVESDWVAPTQPPDLSGANVLGVDIETHDPNLLERGPGFLRRDAEVVGVSLSTPDRGWYFPFKHLGGGNLAWDAVSFVRDTLKDSHRLILTANGQYELEGLNSLGIQIQGPMADVQLTEALIDEELPTYRLEAIARKYCGQGKDESLLIEACAGYGLKDTKGSLWKLPAKYVGPYAEYDSLCLHKIHAEQIKTIQSESLDKVFDMECELIKLLWLMRKQGIPVDLDAANRLSQQLKGTEDELRNEFKEKFGQHVDEWSAKDIAMIADKHKISYPRTANGNPSFTADLLDDSDYELYSLISEIRKCNKMRNTFVDDWLLKWQINGRIHTNWKQAARDDGGTRSGRMAAANPNPQQIPAGKFRKTGKPSPIGKAIRACFRSDTGHWWKGDYKQQEPRILVHFAAISNMMGASIARMAYQNDKEMDFYNFMVEAAHIDRRPAKDMFLGRCYGMGKKKLAFKLNKPIEEAERILAVFDKNLPFVKEIADKCMRLADSRGYVRTLLGRRRHFNYWEPKEYGRMPYGEKPLRLHEATVMWGDSIKRSQTHKALNAVIQGSAADMTKASMLKVWKETGIVPYISMHDEIGAPVDGPDQGTKVEECCTTSVEMTVPIYVDAAIGESWS